MKVLVVTKRDSGAPPTKRTIEAEWLRVGRNASCEIHLPDPRVALEQALIVNRNGLVYLEGEGGSQNITRKSVRAVRLKPGEPIDIGPYRIEALPAPEGFDGALSVQLVRPAQAPTALAERTTRLTLASLGLSKRSLAWGAATAVLALFVLLPAGRVLDLPWREAAQSAGIGDRFWNPGPLLLAHQPIEQKCAACHEVAFEHVKDRACLECHGNIGHHVGPELEPAALFAGSRCTSCHRDHKGVKATHRDDDRFCVDCHRDIRAKAPAAQSRNVTDFARDHPGFRLSIPAAQGLTRARQETAPLTERSNLVFPHALHLDPKGVRSPLQGRMRLECRSCHQPDASRRGFEPVSMPKHCQECHALQFEPAVTTREVPHGKPAEAVVVIEEFYANLALKGTRDSFQKAFGIPGEGLLRRAGAAADDRQGALALAARKAKKVSEELIEVRVCKTCHAIEKSGNEWRVAPVRASNQWLPHARFDHRAHRQAECGSCHAVAQSRDASDIAVPTIAECRECHAGSRPAEGKVRSSCLLCHGFHEAKHPWDPKFRPKSSTRVAEARR